MRHIYLQIIALSATGSVVLLPQTTVAQSMTPQEIKEFSLVDIPLAVDSVDTGAHADQIWASGERPANQLLGRILVKPLEVATAFAPEEARGQAILFRAFTGGGITRLPAGAVQLDGAPRRYCGTLASQRSPVCLSDEDGNGTFDAIAQAVTERGRKAYHITLAKAFAPLPHPITYRVLGKDERPGIRVEVHNCAKDYDRPRYSAQSTDDDAQPLRAPGFGWHNKDSSFSICRRGDRITEFNNTAINAPDGGFAAQLGPLVFAVGPKSKPTITPLGLATPDALYRIEGATLVDLRVGQTPNQAKIAARKKFPYPVLMADTGATIENGPVAPGNPIAQVPFHHAYRGRLTSDIEIRTLIEKRSLPAGSIVYGFPSQESTSLTIGGSLQPTIAIEDSFRRINLALTWCAPVPGPEPRRQNPQNVGRSGWSAACIPQSSAGTYTIINNQQPAFATAGVTYNAETSSNSGPAPIERDSSASFQSPLRIDYIFEKLDGDMIMLRKNIYFGDALTSSSPESVYAPSGQAAVIVAGVPISLSTTAEGTLTAKPAALPVVGANADLEWDRTAMMLAQLKRMGLTIAAEPSEDRAP